MEHTNEFLAAMYGAYYGCHIIGKSSEMGQGEFIDIDVTDKIDGIERLTTISGTEIYINTKYNSVLLSNAKLALTPLSSITDEHAIGLGKSMYPLVEFKVIERDQYMVMLYGFGVHLQILFDLSDNEFLSLETEAGGDLGSGAIKAVDYLRSLGYDCGFRHIPSLIDAGLAIDKTTLT